jgi:tight adherence protein C
MLYVIALGIGLSVGLGVLAIAEILPAQNRLSKARLVELGLEGPFSKDAAARRSRRRNQLNDLFEYLGKTVGKPKRDWSGLRRRMVHAGYRQESAPAIFLGVRIGAAAILYFYGILLGVGLEATGMLNLTLGLLGGATGWIVPGFLLSRRIAKRQREIEKVLPDSVDLLVICVEAGLALNQAFQRVAVEMRHASSLLTEEISQMNLKIRAGTPREEALMDLADRTGVPDVRSLATMLVQTERFGTSIADSLRTHAETMRDKRQQRAEEAAAKTTIKMVFPLAICIFPALFVVILGPAVIQLIQTFATLG